MPASHQSSARTASQPSILLLEEYDALAAAIGSALKKFAGKHAVSIARTLAEAEEVAAKSQPELFIIDVDPPWRGLTDFLEKMRAAYPDARVLAIGAPIPAEIAAERGSFGALQFIEKPFELAAFGAAVQAVLGPWREAESASPRGSLRALSLADVALMHCAANANVVVDVRTGTKKFGEIHIAGGQITHAETGRLVGAEALREMLAWTEVRMTEAKAPASPQRTTHRDWPSIVLEALRTATTLQPPAAAVLPEEAAPAKRPPRTGKKIVVIDDTEMLLIFVEDVLATADPELQITSALNGTDGIRQIERIIPDLVLLDYSLPDLNGDEVCRRLLQNERTARVPVLMMSGHVLEMAAAAARLENIVATIEKPFLSEALVKLVRQTLERDLRPRMKTASPSPAKVSGPAPPRVPGPKPKLVKKAAPVPVSAPEVFEPEWATEPIQRIVRIAAAGENQAVLGLFLEVASMQLTPQLQMGAIRARPISFTVSLHLPSPLARNATPAETAFQLGATELDGNGRISSIRLIPTAKPFQPAQTRSTFEIGGVAVIPNHARARVQLTPAGSTPMTMLLIARLELAAVELSPTFQIGQLILKWRTNAVRVTLNPKAWEQTGATFDTTAVKLDSSARIAELLLNPIR